MKLIVFLLVVINCGLSVAQDKYVDSCKTVLNKRISDTTRARIYIELAEYIGDEKEWMRYNKLALDLAEKKLKTAKGKTRLFYLRTKANAIGNVGYYFDDHGDKDKSLKNYYEALRLYNKAGDVAGKASVLGNIGVIFTDQGDYDEAMSYLKKALKIKKKYYPKQLAKNYLNLGVACEGMGDSLKAINYYKKALTAAKNVGHQIDIATAYNNIGSVHFNRKDFKKSILYLRKAVSHFKIGNDPSGVAWTMANLGYSYFQIDEIDSAFHYNLQAKEISDHYGYPELTQSISEKLYELYGYREDWENALKYYRIGIKMGDSLNNIDVQKKALRQKMAFDHNVEKATMETKRKEEKKRDEQRLFFALIAMVMALIFGVIIYTRLRITKKQKLTIEQQKRETESQKEVIEEKNKEIVDSINYAKRLQEAILPNKDSITKPFADAFLLYMPKDIVAGDFFWMHELNKDEILIAAADCTGHGVPGAMVSVVCANALDRATKEFQLSNTGVILDKVTELVVERLDQSNEDVKDGMDIALCKINLSNGIVQFSGANNPLWIIRKEEREVEVIKGDRQPVGRFDGLQAFNSNEIKLNTGDWLYIFSDGYSDQFGGDKEKKFKSANLKNLLVEIANEKGKEQKERLLREFNKWKGEIEQVDDVCVIGVKK